MRTPILVLLLMSFGLNVLPAQELDAQNEQSTAALYDFHFKKKRTNNLTGWLTLVGGSALVTAGLVVNTAEDLTNEIGNVVTLGSREETNSNDGNWLIYTGGAITLSSIYFFSKAGQHKKKMNVQLASGTVRLAEPINYSGISISIMF